MLSNIVSNLSLFFNYSTLTNEPIMTYFSGGPQVGEYDYENANFGFTYNLPDNQDSLIKGINYTRVDNDSDFLSTALVLTEAEKKLDKLILKTSYGEFGYVSGDKIELVSQLSSEPNYFYYEIKYHTKNDMGNDYWVIPGVNFYLDSDNRKRLSLSLNLEKYLFNSLSLGNELSYTYVGNPDEIIDFKSYWKNSTYLKTRLLGLTGNISYDLISANLKASNATLENAEGLSFSLSRN